MKKHLNVSKVVKLPPEDSGMSQSIVRMNNVHIDSKKLSKKHFFRRDAVKIENLESGSMVIRYVMGNPGTLSISKHSVALDYDAIDVLGVKFDSDVSLDVNIASFIDVYRWFWSYPDLAIRLSIKLGVTGAVLGMMGFIVGVIGPMMD